MHENFKEQRQEYPTTTAPLHAPGIVPPLTHYVHRCSTAENTTISSCPTTAITATRILTIISISDTHGHHREIDMPPGDILIHAGDYTLYGKRHQAEDFNALLGELKLGLQYKHIFVVQGNHEANASWKRSAKNILSNATLLVNECVEVNLDAGEDGQGGSDSSAAGKVLKIHGMDFDWPHLSFRADAMEAEPRFKKIDHDVDILISHCPAEGYLDQNQGCPTLARVVERIQPRLFICGHIHNARGVCDAGSKGGPGEETEVWHENHKLMSTTYVNAATAKGGIRNGHAFGKQPIVLKLIQETNTFMRRSVPMNECDILV